jgi:hypothetical protein
MGGTKKYIWYSSNKNKPGELYREIFILVIMPYTFV